MKIREEMSLLEFLLENGLLTLCVINDRSVSYFNFKEAFFSFKKYIDESANLYVFENREDRSLCSVEVTNNSVILYGNEETYNYIKSEEFMEGFIKRHCLNDGKLCDKEGCNACKNYKDILEGE